MSTDQSDDEEKIPEEFLDIEEFLNELWRQQYEIDRQERMKEASEKLKRQITIYMASHSGVGGFMALLSGMASEWGEGTFIQGKRMTVDPFWMAVSAEIESCRVNIDRLLREYH